MSKVVIFDLDKTLLSGDSTKAWMLMRFKSGKLRFLCAAILAPIALVFLKSKKFKFIGAYMLLFVASFRMDEREMIDSFSSFSSKIRDGEINSVRWFDDGFKEVLKHLKEGRRVIIATAAPELLAYKILDAVNLNIEVIGTPLSKSLLGGWIGGTHCRNEEKVRRIKSIGVSTKWYAAYTDDFNDDYPILLNSENPYLINSTCKKEYVVKNLKLLNWS
ncbi:MULTISPECIES: haloacid dehalogenase-like hydrolase [Serratia]|uniref:haloacid dehalogenase-like hydrolase n=1 Tax=Serratia TaxID=613 RepID=UPI001926E778|nr:haloacid dehalogenase-like hydrolase [Serratia plymuthica]MBL3524919.1 haloacid dehalogenase-like hydrolase [Serratia plymuthica]